MADATKGLRAQINAKAKLTNIGTAADSVRLGQYGPPSQGTAMIVTLKIPMGAPKTVPSWDDFKQQHGGGYRRSDHIDREIRAMKPKPAPKAKAAKGAKAKTAEQPAPAAAAPKINEPAERKRIGDAYDADVRAQWDKAVEKANRSNQRYMERAASFAMFAALRGQDVMLTLAPVQQGFKQLFGANASQASLGAGDASDDDAE